MTSNFPRQLKPEIFFPDVGVGGANMGEKGGETASTAQAFMTQWLRNTGVAKGQLSQAVHQALEGHMGPEAQLPLLDANAAIAALTSDQQATVEQVSKELTATLAPALPQLPGETITGLTASCLSAPVGDHPEGTVVVSFQTDKATRLLLLPFVQVDTRTGVPQLALPREELWGLTVNDGLSPAAQVLVATQLAATASGASAREIVEEILKLGETLAFALPHPWGAIVSGALSLIDMLLGKSKPDPFAMLLHALENFMEEQKVETWGTTINNFTGGDNGLQAQLEVLKTTSADSQTVYIKDTFLLMIKQATNAGLSDNVYAATGGLRDDVQDIINTMKNHTRQQFHDQPPLPLEDTLDLAFLGQAALLLAFKIQIQLYAQLASQKRENGDDQAFNDLTGAWLDAYAQFEININGDKSNNLKGCAAEMTDLLNQAWAARIKLVGDIYEIETKDLSVNDQDFDYFHEGWGFTDALIEDPSIEDPVMGGRRVPKHYALDTYTGGSCCKTAVDHKADLVVVRNNYIAQLQADFLTKRQNIITGWTSSVSEWSSHMPPQPPKEEPSIAADAKWTAATPQGQNWINGNAVRYAIAFANIAGKSGGAPSAGTEDDQSGPSQMGNFGPWTNITDQAFPTVTLPTDPLNQATARWVYRQFKSDGKTHIIKIIPDNTSTDFVDDQV